MKSLIYAILLFSFQTIFAQVIPTKYAEIAIDNKQGENYKVINLGENGILTILESKDYLKGGNQELIISCLDTALNAIWQVKPVIKEDYKIKNYYREKQYLYFLLEKKLTDYEIFELNLENGNIAILKLDDIIPLEVSHFKVFNRIIFLGGEVENRPAVLWYDYLNSKTPKVLPQINTLKAEVRSISYSLDEECVSVLLKPVKTGKPSIFIQNYSLDGHLLNKTEIKSDKEYNLLTFRPYVSNENQQMIIGTYGNKNNELVQGFYVAKFENLEQKSIKLYDLSQLKNYFNYLTEKQKDRLFNKIEKKQEQGKTKTHDVNILLSELIEQDNKLLLFADTYSILTIQNSSYSMQSGAFAPTLFQQPTWAKNTWNSQTTQSKYYNNLVYNYKNSFVIAFDKEGNLLWDNAFEYEDIENRELAQHSTFALVADSITIVSTKKTAFHYKNTYKEITVPEIDKVKIDTIFGKVKLAEEPNPQIIAWYDKYFLAYGTQTIKTYDATKGMKMKEVFFLSKFYCRKKKVVEKK
jgi:hypothetical protein